MPVYEESYKDNNKQKKMRKVHKFSKSACIFQIKTCNNNIIQFSFYAFYFARSSHDKLVTDDFNGYNKI